MSMITMIKKRDGREVPFNIEKIANAVLKAAQSVGGNNYNEALEIADKVCQKLSEKITSTSSSSQSLNIR